MPRKSVRNARRKSTRRSKRSTKSASYQQANTKFSNTVLSGGRKDVITSTGIVAKGVKGKTWNSGPFPQAVQTKMRYVDSFIISCQAGGAVGATQIIRLNSVYDPDQVNTGHQPQGYNDLERIYNRYLVYGVSIKIEVPPSNQVGLALAYRFNPANDGWALTGRRCNQPFEQSTGGGGLISSNMPTVFDLGYMSIGAVQGQPNSAIMNGLLYASAPGFNPSVVPTLQIGLGSIDYAAEVTSHPFMLTIVYHVQWDNLYGQNAN